MSDHTFSVSDKLEWTAEWRREKAEEFPDDKRNLEAAEELERLAAEVDALDGTEIDKQISELEDSIERFGNWESVTLDIQERLFGTVTTPYRDRAALFATCQCHPAICVGNAPIGS